VLGRITCLLFAGVVFCSPLLRADEQTRQVQEELRKRNLYFGDIDGCESPALSAALKQYQERKGFSVTGELDPDTVRSMAINSELPGKPLPNVPVLRSDLALAEGSKPGRDLSFVNTVEPVKIAPPTRDEIRAFLRSYLDACQTPPVNDDLTFYGGRIAYFRHGNVTKTYIKNELVAYNQQWPERHYGLGDAITIGKHGVDTVVKCQVSFKVENVEQNRAASGVTNNTFFLARHPDSKWEIVGLREERVRPAAKSRTRSNHSHKKASFGRRLQRTMRKFFH
jgi:Putative peptidoglycan binding domain